MLEFSAEEKRAHAISVQRKNENYVMSSSHNLLFASLSLLLFAHNECHSVSLFLQRHSVVCVAYTLLRNDSREKANNKQTLNGAKNNDIVSPRGGESIVSALTVNCRLYSLQFWNVCDHLFVYLNKYTIVDSKQ